MCEPLYSFLFWPHYHFLIIRHIFILYIISGLYPRANLGCQPLITPILFSIPRCDPRLPLLIYCKLSAYWLTFAMSMSRSVTRSHQLPHTRIPAFTLLPSQLLSYKRLGSESAHLGPLCELFCVRVTNKFCRRLFVCCCTVLTILYNKL